MTFSRVVRTAHACRLRLKAERRDPWPLMVLCVILVIAGDDLVIWAAGLVNADVGTWIVEWGATATTIGFGFVPASVLAAWVFVPEWRESWRGTAD